MKRKKPKGPIEQVFNKDYDYIAIEVTYEDGEREMFSCQMFAESQAGNLMLVLDEDGRKGDTEVINHRHYKGYKIMKISPTRVLPKDEEIL